MRKETMVVTGLCRLGYVKVLKPVAFSEEDAPKYSVQVMVPKKDKTTLKELNEAITLALENGKSKCFGGKIPAASSLRMPLRDGDAEFPDDENYEGMMFFNCTNTKKPMVVDRKRDLIEDDTEIYSGMWGKVALNAYAFNKKSKGVAMSLSHIQKVKDGEPLGGGRAIVENVFEIMDDDDVLG